MSFGNTKRFYSVTYKVGMKILMIISTINIMIVL